MNVTGNEIVLTTPGGIYLKSGETFIFSFNKSVMSAYSNQIKHLAAPTDDNDATTKKFVEDEITSRASNSTTNLKLNSNPIWFNDTRAVRMHSTGENIEIISNAGVY